MKRKIKGLMIPAILLIALLTGCSAEVAVTGESANATDATMQTQQATENIGYGVDYLKISPMIADNVSKEVIDAAKAVIEAFLNYENTAQITIVGNEARFLNDMGYVINCTCPMFSAFTDYNEMTSYDAQKKAVTWNYFISQKAFNKTVTAFTHEVESYLSAVDKADSDAMKAILLYCAMVQNASYDYEILGDAYETMDPDQYHLRNSPYYALVNKTGICTNLSQGLLFLYTQADLASGTVLHQGGAGAHMWVVVRIDDRYYYCDPTWDVGDGPKTFGITAEDRSSWAGGYAKDEGSMLDAVIPQKYEINDDRFGILREKLPAETTGIKADKEKQTITFEGDDYQYTFSCMQ